MKKPFLLASLPTALIFTLVLSLISPVFSNPVRAQAEGGTRIGISPVTFNLTANPGDTLDQVIKVRNDAAATQQITIEAENFTAVGEEGQVALTDEDTSFNLASWIEFESSTFVLGSGEEIQVPFLIRVPGNAEPGGHYASVFAHVGPVSPDGSGSAIGQKIGSLILLRVAGDVEESASVESFAVGKFDPGQPVPFEIRVKNQGSVHIRPAGFVTINDFMGNKVKDVSIEDSNIFPGAIRKIHATWEDPGFIGRYTANALMYYGDTNQQLTATTTFWIIPWKTVGIVAGAALVVVLILWFGRRRIGRSIKALVSGS